jgi:hypothetical protein
MMLQFNQQMGGACDTPLVRMFGQSPAGLNASGEADLRMYYEMINAKQEAKHRGAWELILKCMWRSELGTNMPDDAEFTFNPLAQMTIVDKANAGKAVADAVTTAMESGIITKPCALRELKQASGENGLFSNISDEDIEEAEEEPPAPDEEGPNILAETGLNEQPKMPGGPSKEEKISENVGDSKSWLRRKLKW